MDTRAEREVLAREAAALKEAYQAGAIPLEDYERSMMSIRERDERVTSTALTYGRTFRSTHGQTFYDLGGVMSLSPTGCKVSLVMTMQWSRK